MTESIQKQKLRRSLLFELQKIDFVLVELNLYLDTHPSDQNAMQQYNALVQQRAQARINYESKFGPLYNFGNSYDQLPNEWNKGPWPWEI